MRVLVLYNDPEPVSQTNETAVLDRNAHGYSVNVSGGSQTGFVDISNEGMAEEVHAIAGSLERVGFTAGSLNVKNNLALLLETLERKDIEVIFNLVESFHNESEPEMYVAGLYDLYKIPYTGAGPKALGNCLDKILTKQLLGSYGISVPRFFVAGKTNRNGKSETLEFPLIVKPVHEDASAGIENDSIVYTGQQLENRVGYIHSYFKQDALVEEYIRGREFNVSVFGNNPAVTLPVSEIDFSGMPGHLHHIVSYQAKWVPEHEAYMNTVPVCPAAIPESLAFDLSRTAISAAGIMGTRDYARVDMRVDGQGKIFVLEVNPNPDISRDAGFMRAARVYGWSHEETLKRIVEMAYARS